MAGLSKAANAAGLTVLPHPLRGETALLGAVKRFNFYRHRTAELTLFLRHGTVLDLHWDLVNQASLRDRVRAPAVHLLGRRRGVVVNGVEVTTLDDLDFALHVILHACLSGCSELRWLLDVQQLLRSASFTPDELADRATSWRVGPHVRVVLESAATFVDPQIQRWAAAVGRRTMWVRFLARLSRRRPPSAPSVSSHSVRNWYRSTRDTGPATLAAVAHMLLAGLHYRRRGFETLRPKDMTDDLDYARWIQLAESEHCPSRGRRPPAGSRARRRCR